MTILEHPEAVVLLADAELSTEDVSGCRAHLSRFLKRYLPLFRRQEQRGHASAFLQGLLSNLQRKSVEPIARQAGILRKNLQMFRRTGGLGRRGGRRRDASARPPRSWASPTALALRQAIWRKGRPGWQVCGIPGILYSDPVLSGWASWFLT